MKVRQSRKYVDITIINENLYAHLTNFSNFSIFLNNLRNVVLAPFFNSSRIYRYKVKIDDIYPFSI